jgi:hypothetical protein
MLSAIESLDQMETESQFGTDPYRCLNNASVSDRRAKEAWEETSSDWKPELLYAVVGGVISIIALLLAGWPKSHLLSYGIPIASVVLAAVVVPLAQFIWKLLWQPWENMKADVHDMQSKLGSMAAMPDDLAAIKERLENPPTAIPEKPTEAPIDKRLTALNYIRSYDDESKTGIFALRRAESIQRWTDEVVQFLSKHVSSEAAERMLTADQNDRRDVLAEIVKEMS